MTRYAIALALLAGCATPAPVTAPQPTTLTSPLSPSAVVQTAVATLAAKGFTVTTSDATNGILVATHAIPEGDAETAKELLACRWGPNAIGWKMTSGASTITVNATPSGTGSAVTITGTARTGTPGECASSGATEAAIAAAITR